jgi:hypothetical protein
MLFHQFLSAEQDRSPGPTIVARPSSPASFAHRGQPPSASPTQIDPLASFLIAHQCSPNLSRCQFPTRLLYRRSPSQFFSTAPTVLHSRQAYHPNHITPVQLLDHIPTPLQSPACRNIAAIIELHHRRLGSPPFHPLRSTPTITSPPTRFPLVP